MSAGRWDRTAAIEKVRKLTSAARRVRLPARLMDRPVRLLGDTAQLSLVAGIALIAGIGSSVYLIDRGTPFNVVRQGPWVQWLDAGRPDADPYTRSRFAVQASLVMDGAVVRRFEARTDDSGRRLNAACEYGLTGREPQARWWSLSLFDDAGLLVANPAGRHGFNRDTLARRPDGSYSIAIAREARPDNWLPAGPGGPFVLVYEVQEPLDQDAGAPPAVPLPALRRIGC